MTNDADVSTRSGQSKISWENEQFGLTLSFVVLLVWQVQEWWREQYSQVRELDVLVLARYP